ncbi:hypothetical protein AMS58_20855 [Pseudoalteromonas porphyrae]|uniref:Uncharacterized protein n=1 Tax=Pseudoalteromonas porphyrae TaxID=187330 RepID=A0A0N1EIQ4_9GAMM|nr:hypothetical protein ADS77_14600 [Pseudoalteromonas porphyrae]KPH92778.1 hypothetical protein AMS58_20855 [Pseudoalteromonas porphyrae]
MAYFGLKGFPFFNASCFAAFLCYEQGSTVAKEQQYWFEQLKFWIDAHAIKCFECRKKTRAINRLKLAMQTWLLKNLERQRKINYSSLQRSNCLI